MQDNSGARRIARTALAAFGTIAAGATVIAVIESYSNLLAFALAYGLSGWRAAIAPGAVDSFVILGELLLFAAVILAWPKTLHVFGAVLAAWGFALSVGGNVWHAASATAADRAVSAIWPVTATAGLAGALLIVRQVVSMTSGREAVIPVQLHKTAKTAVPRQASRPGRHPRAENQAMVERLLASGRDLPSARGLARAESWSRARAENVLGQARAAMNGGGHELPSPEAAWPADPGIACHLAGAAGPAIYVPGTADVRGTPWLAGFLPAGTRPPADQLEDR